MIWSRIYQASSFYILIRKCGETFSNYFENTPQKYGKKTSGIIICIGIFSKNVQCNVKFRTKNNNPPQFCTTESMTNYCSLIKIQIRFRAKKFIFFKNMVNKNSIIIIHSCLLSSFTLGFSHTAFFYIYKHVEIIQYYTSIQIYWTTNVYQV